MTLKLCNIVHVRKIIFIKVRMNSLIYKMIIHFLFVKYTLVVENLSPEDK